MSKVPSPFRRATLLRDEVSGPEASVYGSMLGAVAFVLLIVCANLAGLLLARGTARRRELAARYGATLAGLDSVQTPADWLRRRDEILRHWHERMGPWPRMLERPRLELVEKRDRGDVTEHRVEVEVAPGVMQHGFLLARQMLSRQTGTKQIIMITDGEPTAHITPRGDVFFNYPPAPDTLEATLREAARCTREGIRINTFMLDADWGLRHFVEQMTRLNRGRAFFTTPDTLGDYVLVDFLEHRRMRRAG